MTTTNNSTNQPSHKLHALKYRPVPPERAARLKRWYVAWQMEQELRRDPSYAEPLQLATATAEAGVQPNVAPFNDDVSTGQIRLLDPLLLEDSRRPVYVLILNKFDEDQFLVAPFGSFSEPATTTEWLTGRTDSTLRVLCLWNTTSLSSASLKRSWLVERVSEQELDDAREVLRHAMSGSLLPDKLLPEVGSPILLRQDPRRRYQAEESKLFAALHRREEQAEDAEGRE